MKKVRRNKNTIITAIFTIAVLSSINFAIYPKTNSAYDKKEEHFLAFNDQIQAYKNILGVTPIDISESITLDDGTELKSTENDIILKITFDRDDVNAPDSTKKETHKDIYRLATPKSEKDLKNVCTILNKQGSNYSINTTTGIIEFNTSASKDQKNNDVYISCPADYKYNPDYKPSEDATGNYSNYYIKLYEHIEDNTINYKEEEFLYASKLHYFDYDEYSNQFRKPSDENTILINNPDGSAKSDEDIYQEFLELIKTHVKNSNYKNYFIKTVEEKEVLDEIFENYINDNNITSTNAKLVLMDEKGFNLLGVIRTLPKKNEEEEIIGYGFDFDDNFIGYVKTHDFYTNKIIEDGNFVYFSSEDASEIQTAFKNSINEWVFKNNNKIYKIGDETYTAKSLIIKYIDTYLKDRNWDYSLANLEKIVPLYSDTDDIGYKHIAFGSTTIDYAYNYLAKNYGTIRVSYYDIFEDAIATVQMQNISRAAISNLRSNGNITATISNMLRSEIGNTSTDLYKTVTCRDTCTDFIRLYYSNGVYYKVIVTHNEAEKYNEIKISKDTSFDNIANGLYDSNVIDGIKENVALNQAIICATSNCSEYKEIYYNVNKGEYLLAKVKPNTNYLVNEISVSTGSSFDSIATDLTKINVAGIQKILNNPEGSSLKQAIICDNDCDEYNELHYNYNTTDKKYFKVSVIPDNNNQLNKLTINESSQILEGLDYIINNNKTLEDSINASIKDELLEASLTYEADENITSYEIHHDNDYYYLFAITTDAANKYNSLTITKIKGRGENASFIDTEAISKIDVAFIYHIKDEDISDLVSILGANKCDKPENSQQTPYAFTYYNKNNI